MKSIFKKGLVVLVASLFVSSVFAATEEATAAKPVAEAHAAVKHAKKEGCGAKCHNAKNSKKCVKHCKKMMHHHKMMKKAEATTTAPAEHG